MTVKWQKSNVWPSVRHTNCQAIKQHMSYVRQINCITFTQCSSNHQQHMLQLTDTQKIQLANTNSNRIINACQIFICRTSSVRFLSLLLRTISSAGCSNPVSSPPQITRKMRKTDLMHF